MDSRDARYSDREHSYEWTHPFINWRFDFLDRIDRKTWLQLGEIQSKCEHLAYAPLRPDIRKALYRVHFLKGVKASAAIEGNTLTDDDVDARDAGKLASATAPVYQVREIDNLLDLTRSVASEALGGIKPITPEWLVLTNHRVLQGIGELPLARTAAGYADTGMQVNAYRGPAPSNFEPLVEHLCIWLNGDGWKGWQDMSLAQGIVKAIVAHVYMLWIHPFPDGNGRTARLLEFRLLMEAGVPSIAAHLLTNHYNRTRETYFDCVARTHDDHTGHLEDFVAYAVEGLSKALREQVDAVRAVVIDDVRRNIIFEAFREYKESAAGLRRRELALSLPVGEGMERKRLRYMTPRLSELYAGLGLRAVARDVNALVEMGFALEDEDGVRANLKTVVERLPARVKF